MLSPHAPKPRPSGEGDSLDKFTVAGFGVGTGMMGYGYLLRPDPV